ncbi:hypothetical protein [Massilia glaciei]|uniref:Proline-rich protein n=1 Tax=Massilia glaciei TaxID=1524097 RepID=A0A2U2I4X4_9BURK|nr:hypothetical protein [Massilia glaciei]PWF54854.1 hypothetical protein C7C56_004705 [Massilia glaciei]
MKTSVYDKTDKGREEIATRKYQVPSKLRALLLLVDGRHTLEVLLKNVAGLGLTQEHMTELLEGEYIVLISGGEVEQAPAEPVARRLSSARARVGTHARAPVYTPSPEELAALAEAERFRALQDFYSQTVKSTFGLRGFALQMKVEKASTVDDLRALRLPYLEAVLKAKGSEMALSLRDRLDHLLGEKPDSDEFVA